MKKFSFFVLFLLIGSQILSQQVGKIIISPHEENNDYIKYPDFACEFYIGTNYTYLFIPKQLTEVINGNGGLFNLNAGVGFKFRIKNKLYLGFGYGYWENSLNQNYQATFEYNNDSSVVYDIAEEGKICNKGAYFYIGEERKKIFYRLGMSMGLFTRYKGNRSIYDQGIRIFLGEITEDNYIVTDKYSGDIKLFLKFGYNKKINPNFIIKPFISMSYSFSPVCHTRYFITKKNGNDKELNMHFATFNFGITADMGMGLSR